MGRRHNTTRHRLTTHSQVHNSPHGLAVYRIQWGRKKLRIMQKPAMRQLLELLNNIKEADRTPDLNRVHLEVISLVWVEEQQIKSAYTDGYLNDLTSDEYFAQKYHHP